MTVVPSAFQSEPIFDHSKRGEAGTDEEGVDGPLAEPAAAIDAIAAAAAKDQFAARAAAARAAADAGAALAARIVPMAAPEPSAALLKQTARVGWVREQLEALPLHADPQRDAVLGAYASRAELLRKQSRRAPRARGGGDGGGGGDSWGLGWLDELRRGL